MVENASNSAINNNGPNVLDKERNTMSEDPKWQGKCGNFRTLFDRICITSVFIFRYCVYTGVL